MHSTDSCKASALKIKAVFLVGVVIMWGFAGTVAFAGTAAAQTNHEQIDGYEAFQGDEVKIQFDGAPNYNDGDMIQIREVTDREDGVPIASTTRLTYTSEDGWLNFSTSNLAEGNYVIRNAEYDYGYLNNTGGFNETTLQEVDPRPAEFTVIPQTVSVSFDDGNGGEIVTAGDTIELNYDSPERASGYTVNVSEANGELSAAELNDILSDLVGTAVDDIDDSSYDNADTVQLEGVSNSFTENVIIPSAIAGGDYNLVFDVVDTTAEDTASMTVVPDVEPTDLTYTFEIPNDGETYSLGIPGEVEGSLAEIADPTLEGYTVFVFEDGEWTPATDFENTNLDALDSIAIATENSAGQADSFTFEIEFETQSATTIPAQTELNEGWNVVAAPQRGNVGTVFGVEDVFLVLDRFEEADSTEVPSTTPFNNHFIGSDENTATPFKGYYVYAEDETTLPGVLSGVESRDDIENQLNVGFTE